MPRFYDDDILNELEREDPDLIARYRERMSKADSEIDSAKNAQRMAGYADVAGQAFTDFGNAGKRDILYKNKMSKLGNAPECEVAERDEWKSVMPAFDRQLANAKADRSDEMSRFGEETQLRKMQSSQDLDDPNSATSQKYRDYLKTLSPTAAQMPGLDKMSASEISNFAPGFQKKMEMEAAAAAKRAAIEAAAGEKNERIVNRNQDREQRNQERADDKTQKRVESLSKDVSGIQGIDTALQRVESELGAPLDSFKIQKGGLYGADGKKRDLPGVSLPGVGRTSFFSGDARQLTGAIESVFNTELKDRSGAAVTNNEMERLKREFATGKFNSEAEMIGALQAYKRALAQEWKNREAAYPQEVLDVYKERGGRTSGPAAAPQGGKGTPTFNPSDIQAELKKRGLR